jgi:hypothetical protein
MMGDHKRELPSSGLVGADTLADWTPAPGKEAIPTPTSLPPCSRRSRTSPAGGPIGPSLTAAARDDPASCGSGRKNGSRGQTEECETEFVGRQKVRLRRYCA